MAIVDTTWQSPFVKLETSFGDILIELYWRHAPKACRNFCELARRGYYNNVKFHKIIRNDIVQSGDPSGTGRGGASIYGAPFEDEIHLELKHTGAGIVSMASAGRNRNGSQFFITLAPAQRHDNVFTIFGRVASGIKIVDRIGKAEVDSHDRPTSEIVIKKAFPIDDPDEAEPLR